MECLYKTTIKFTYEEYKKFNDAIMWKKYLIIVSILACLLILTGGILLQNLFLILFAIVYPFLFFLAKNIGVKKFFESNTLLKDKDISFEFYEDCFEIKHEAGDEKIPYDKLCDIVETKTNFYLMIAKNQGYIIIKENMPEGLDEFLRGKKQVK
jgi:hypothetical protein